MTINREDLQTYHEKHLEAILKKISLEQLISIAVPIIDIIVPIKPSPAVKYTNREYFIGILKVLVSGTAWRNSQYTIPGKTLNAKHQIFCNTGTYQSIFEQCIDLYLEDNGADKKKYQSLDSSSIQNKGCTELASATLYKGPKKHIKVSAIVGTYGMPFAVTLVDGKKNDNITLEETVNELPSTLNTKENSTNNRYKQYMLADTGYCSQSNRDFLIDKGYIPLIRFNKRNNSNEEYINSMKFSPEDNQRYKKRTVVESFFSWIKNYPKINNVYEKTAKSYLGLVKLACILQLVSKI
jgi:transposase